MTEELADGRDRRPVPDPTKLTTEAVTREIAGVITQLNALERLMFGEIKHRGDLTDEQFRSVYAALDAVRQRAAEQKTDTEKAVGAALTAAKELVALQNEASTISQNKTEAAVVKQIDSLRTAFEQSNLAMNEKITEIGKRVERIEGKQQGSQASIGMIVGVVGVAIAIIGLIVAAANVLTSS